MTTTRRYPRTLEQAFGPHTSRDLHTEPPRSSLRAWAAYLLVLAAAVACAGLSGCMQTMTNDQVIAEVRKCRNAGMEAKLYRNAWQPSITNVVCDKPSLLT